MIINELIAASSHPRLLYVMAVLACCSPSCTSLISRALCHMSQSGVKVESKVDSKVGSQWAASAMTCGGRWVMDGEYSIKSAMKVQIQALRFHTCDIHPSITHSIGVDLEHYSPTLKHFHTWWYSIALSTIPLDAKAEPMLL